VAENFVHPYMANSLLNAAARGDLATVTRIVTDGGDVNETDQYVSSLKKVFMVCGPDIWV
jgi:hypothetical protein